MDSLERVTTYLRTNLAGVTASATTPHDRKSHKSLVTVSRAGGTRSRFLDAPRMVIDCHAGSIAESYELAERVSELLVAMPDSDAMVSDVGPCSIYRNEWTEGGSPCHSVSCPMVINT